MRLKVMDVLINQRIFLSLINTFITVPSKLVPQIHRFISASFRTIYLAELLDCLLGILLYLLIYLL